MIGRRFRRAKQRVALFCVALCLALSAQMTVALADRLEHALGIPHAPNAVAGAVAQVADHHHDHADHEVPHSHHHDGDAADGDGDHALVAPHHHDHDKSHHHSGDGALPHEHQTQGMLLPWIIAAPIELAPRESVTAEYRYSVAGHPDAPVWRRDRPPKPDLEGIA